MKPMKSMNIHPKPTKSVYGHESDTADSHTQVKYKTFVTKYYLEYLKRVTFLSPNGSLSSWSMAGRGQAHHVDNLICNQLYLFLLFRGSTVSLNVWIRCVCAKTHFHSGRTVQQIFMTALSAHVHPIQTSKETIDPRSNIKKMSWLHMRLSIWWCA